MSENKEEINQEFHKPNNEFLKHFEFLKDIKYLILLFILAMIHIGNVHYAYKLMLETKDLSRKLKEKRWDYLTTSSDLMNRSKQSEVAKELEGTGLVEISNPPYKIEAEEENEIEK